MARLGSPGAVVRAEVLAHFRGNKIIIFRYKSKVRYRRKTGHRQSLTRLRITDILVDGASSLRAEEPEPASRSEPVTIRPVEPAAVAEERPRVNPRQASRRSTLPTEAPAWGGRPDGQMQNQEARPPEQEA